MAVNPLPPLVVDAVNIEKISKRFLNLINGMDVNVDPSSSVSSTVVSTICWYSVDVIPLVYKSLIAFRSYDMKLPPEIFDKPLSKLFNDVTRFEVSARFWSLLKPILLYIFKGILTF